MALYARRVADAEVPAQTVAAILAGMAAVGVDVAAVRAEAGLPSVDTRPGERWPGQALQIAWDHALRRFPRPTLPAEVARATPFGAFGVVDYLVASADTLGGSLRGLVTHFRGIVADPSLALVEEEGGTRLEVYIGPSERRWVTEEFTLAMTLKNLRHTIGEASLPDAVVSVCRADPEPGALARVFGARVEFGAAVPSLWFPAASLELPLRTADPHLLHTLGVIAGSMGLGQASDPFELAVRARLRDMLPHGDADAAVMARVLGTSERTLHRRLQERGTTWRAVLDGFRDDESRRFLREGRRSLAEIALAVGFSDQSAWTRAFRRWTGQSPTAWARARS